MDMLMTGSGKVGFSKRIGLSKSHRVSPVMASLTPMTATMSPASARSRGMRSLADIWNIRLMFSFVPLLALSTRVPCSSTPE